MPDNNKPITLNRPYITGTEWQYMSEAHASGHLAGDGQFTKRCHTWLEKNTGCQKALLTHSCTAALDMAAILADVRPGDEVIMPSFTFVSTANAFVLRGAVPVFVDVRSDTFNLDETKIAAAITRRTKAVVPVHYAGVACEMSAITAIAKQHHLLVVEDAAQAILSSYRGQPLGTIGQLGTLSFHETKNVISGEGGALLINDQALIERAEVIREKGTNRSRFFRGEVDKYTWIDIGSSFLPGELIAAFLFAQLEQAQSLTARRLGIWNTYHAAFADLEARELVRRPIVPKDCQHNAHMYYLVLRDLPSRQRFIAELKDSNIFPVFHYVPLHDSPAGRKWGRVVGDLSNTVRGGECLVRLPLWIGLEDKLGYVIARCRAALLRFS
jgi:dTDP-4-amino-4,6-dideoxygalactose transaminase